MSKCRSSHLFATVHGGNMSKKITHCGWCGNDLDDEEIEQPYWASDHTKICRECFQNEYEEECGVCGNYYDKRYKKSRFILLVTKCPGDYGDIEPGYYYIIKYPIFTSNYFNAWLHKDSIRRIAPITPDVADPDSSIPGREICKSCVTKLELSRK